MAPLVWTSSQVINVFAAMVFRVVIVKPTSTNAPVYPVVTGAIVLTLLTISFALVHNLGKERHALQVSDCVFLILHECLFIISL